MAKKKKLFQVRKAKHRYKSILKQYFHLITISNINTNIITMMKSPLFLFCKRYKYEVEKRKLVCSFPMVILFTEACKGRYTVYNNPTKYLNSMVRGKDLVPKTEKRTNKWRFMWPVFIPELIMGPASTIFKIFRNLSLYPI